MSTTLELENENRTRYREELSFEKQEDGTVLVTAVEDNNNNPYGYRDNGLFDMCEYTLSKEQIMQVIEFLTACVEE